MRITDNAADQHVPDAGRSLRTAGEIADRNESVALLDELASVNNELVSTQRQLQRRTAELDRSNRKLHHTNQRLNMLLGMAAHDLRNPIGAVGGFAQTLLLRVRDRLDDRELAVLEHIETSSGRMLALVNELLELSAVDSGALQLDLEECEMHSVVADAVQLAGMAADDKDITLELTSPTPCCVVADQAKLDQVVTNLLTNAIKYSHRGGHVAVTLECDDDGVVLRVADDGVGIPADEQGTIFEPFTRAGTRPTEGEASTGLGLAIVQRIVSGHGGTITVDSAVGRGTTFTVVLPRRPEPDPG